jgi:FG-GAP-like repeat
MYWTQTGIIDDFNKDGYNDLILAGTGPDQGPPRGEMPYLLLGSPNGLKDASDILPRKNMYTHQSVFADFNNDGKKDFFFINNSYINSTTQTSLTTAFGSQYEYTNQAVLILSSTSGWQEKLVSNNYLNFQSIPNNYSTAISLDFNGDGNLDLALAGSNFGGNAHRIMLLRGDGTGGFQEDSSFSPTKAFGSGTVYGNVNSFDLNGDGSDELLLISTNHTGQAVPWGGAVIQAFERAKTTGIWTEVTQKHFPTVDISNKEPTYGSPNDSSVWVKKSFFIDVDQDGDKDMILSSIAGIDEIQSGKILPRLLINNSGVFEPTPLSALTMSGFGSLIPYEIDGEVTLVGASNVYGGYGLNIFSGAF